MRKLILFAVFSLATTGAAFAGGMGDSSAVLKEKNAICEMQRRGIGPLYPNMCLPELPLSAPEPQRGRRG